MTKRGLGNTDKGEDRAAGAGRVGKGPPESGILQDGWEDIGGGPGRTGDGESSCIVDEGDNVKQPIKQVNCLRLSTRRCKPLTKGGVK